MKKRGVKSFLNMFFKLEERKTTVAKEFLAGLTTFFAVVYIIFVNPSVLGAAGMDEGAVFTATIAASIFGTLLIGLLANYPVVIAPGMGMNVFFAFTVVAGLGYTWRQALACSFAAGVLFLILSISKLSKTVMDAIPLSMKYAVVAGIGFFIAFVGLKTSGIIVAKSETLVGLGNFRDLGVLLTIIGLLATFVMLIRRIPAAIFIGMVITVVVGLIIGEVETPKKIVVASPSIMPTFGAFMTAFSGDAVFTLDMIAVVLSFLLVGFFDMTGTLTSIALRTDMIDDKGKLSNGEAAVFANAGATLFSSIAGTSPTASYVESLAGIEVGGRTGLTAVFAAVFLSATLLFSGLLSVVTAQVTAPALISVGVLMVSSLKDIEWNKLEIAIPAFAMIIVMALSYGITNGIAAGFFLYPITMFAAGRRKEIHPIMWILSVVFLLYFVFLGR